MMGGVHVVEGRDRKSEGRKHTIFYVFLYKI